MIIGCYLFILIFLPKEGVNELSKGKEKVSCARKRNENVGHQVV
jgi:hypothetical protein